MNLVGEKPLRREDYLALAEENRRLTAEVVRLRTLVGEKLIGKEFPLACSSARADLARMVRMGALLSLLLLAPWAIGHVVLFILKGRR